MGLPPTGRRATSQGILIYEIENAKIVDHWMQFDWGTLMQQLTEAPVAMAQ